MEMLPTEILSLISSYFCFHCQHPDLFPHANTDEVLNNKKSLARLCRTSKRICAVVQPTLYHYYASGNFPIKPRLYDGDEPRYNTERNYLPQFLRTLSRRSGLASHVVKMQLTQEADKRDGPHRSSCMFHANKSPTLIDYHGLRELLDELRLPNDVGIPEPHGSASQWPRYSRLTPLHWLVTLALILTPRLQSLLLVIDYDAQFYLLAESPHLQFPQLRRLGLMSYQLDYAIDEFEALYIAAPNLEIINASDADGLHKYFTGGSSRQLQHELPLGNLRKLAVAGLVPEGLRNLLLYSVSNLEDLEFYWHEWCDDGHVTNVIDLQDLLWPACKTLRRLCLSYMPLSGEFECDDEPRPKYIQFPYVDNFAPIRTLSGFEQLGELMLDCRSIYREEQADEANRLVSLLPPSIQSFRIAFVFMDMEKSLTQLALEAPEKFPRLKQMHIGFSERNRRGWKDGMERTKTVGSLFTAAGIQVVWSMDSLAPHSRTIIPGVMDWSRLVPLPKTNT